MKLLKIAALFLSILVIPSVANASGVMTVITLSETEETVGTIGLRLEFGDVVRPSIVAGVRRTTTDTDNDVTGFGADLAFPLDPDSGFSPVLRIMGIFGDTNVQGQAGVGFDFGNNQPLIGLGAQGDYVDGGLNIYQDKLVPYAGVSSYDGAPDRKRTVTTTGGTGPGGIDPTD